MLKGFTLIELILVIAIVLLLAAIIFPIGWNFYQIQIFNQTEDQLVSLLKQARNQAMNQKFQADYGVYIAGTDLVLFQGENYQQRQQSEDLIIDLSGFVGISGLNEIVFKNGSGEPVQAGSIILSSGVKSKEIKINQVGLINY